MKFCITIRLILTLFVDQSMSSLGKTDFLIQMQIKKCIYLMKQLRIFFLFLYHTRQSFVMITIPHGSTAKLKIWSRKKILLRSAISKTTVISNYFEHFESLQNLLTVTIEKSKEQFNSQILNKTFFRVKLTFFRVRLEG